MSLVARVADLPDAVVDQLLSRAHELRRGSPPQDCSRRVVSLMFLDASLRTRTGFAAAAARLGAATVDVTATRGNAVSMPESWQATLRTLSGYSDACVARVTHSWVDSPLPQGVDIPVVSGGDSGPDGEHPTQALIDLFAMSCLVGPLDELHVAVCGDLRMRSCRSLLSLLSRRQPARLTLVTEPELREGLHLPEPLEPLVAYTSLPDLAESNDVDVLYVVGIPHLALPEAGRSRLRVGVRHLRCLTPRGGVFSPLPVIDEWESDVVTHERQRAWDQSDLGLFVRMAVLEWALESSPGQRIS